MAATVPAPIAESDAGSRGALSRRDFIKLSGGVSAALGTLGALGVSLAPSVAHARTLRIRNAQLTKQTRDETFQETTSDGKTLMSTTAIFSLGGATIDNEWNYAHSKLMRGLGVVAIENQARI